MNLIEQLGGYEAAKEYLANLEKIPMHEQTEDTLYWLPDMLLQYRRQHNIFEVGDKIVSTLDGSEDWKNAICEILAFHKKMAITTGFSCAIHHYDYRHATPEEIKAGRRL